jgi:hypothetical protein
MSAAADRPPKRMEIFRAADAAAFSEIDVMDVEGVTPELGKTFAELMEAGFDEGQTVKLLFAAPGFSLTYAWFKSGFPLPRHSHNADCLYYIVGGSLTLGSEILGQGDGFFVPRDAAYAYVPGPEGVEVLEFRTAERFNIRFLAANPAFWTKAMATIRSERAGWAGQHPPSSRRDVS